MIFNKPINYYSHNYSSVLCSFFLLYGDVQLMPIICTEHIVLFIYDVKHKNTPNFFTITWRRVIQC